ARINFLIRTALTDVRRVNGHFEVAAFQRPARIYPDRCTHCDKCIEVCPGEGALDRSPLDGALCVREDACLFFKDGSCRSCVEACPEGAINLDARGEEIRLDASALVLACGFKPFDPADKPRFGYGRVPGVISGLDLDAMLRSDSFYQGEGEKRIRSVAFIQCVGSRDPKLGLNYCSRVCCGYALRLARLLKHRFEGIEPVMFYMDIQSFDRDFERRLDAARREVRLVRAIPSEVRAGADGRPELIYYGPNETRVSESYDLVVLSIGISPDPANESLGVLLGAGSNQDGFVGSEGEEVSSGAPGVFVAGAVQGPKSITETVTHAIRAAGQVAAYLKQSRQGANN
ncbi:MAG: CoB--CoM heterodisulfide reductase iron-sulfur subunit A family protein, partial [Deltaproteobacteria bacterium]|nr:CoB--CoM heterodisulfide reductase iron-sulfur subunit A family protein [Deltaproteobacteria bacterium]